MILAFRASCKTREEEERERKGSAEQVFLNNASARLR